MARHTKLTPEIQQKIVQAIESGNYFEIACQYAGVGKATGYEWLARGEGTDKDRRRTRLYAEFADAVRQAEANAEVETVVVIKSGVPENPRLALDFLARRFPSRWGQKDTLTILQRLAAEAQGMTDEDLRAAIARGRPRPDTPENLDDGGPPAGS